MKGFTRIELACVVALVALCVALALPMVNRLNDNRLLSAQAERGRTIYTVLYAQGMFLDPFIRESYKNPDPHEFPTSTDYFRSLITNRVINTGYDFFSGIDAQPCKSDDPHEFTETNNAWCVTAHFDKMTNESSPVYISRNVSLAAIGSGETPRIKGKSRLGKRYWMFITRGGSSHVAPTDLIEYWNTGDEIMEVLNP